MRLVNVDDLKSDMVLAKNIYDNNNNILLKEGYKKIYKHKERLKALGIKSVYIKDEVSEDIEIEPVISQENRKESEEAVREVIKDISQGRKINTEKINQQVNNLIDDIIQNKNVVVNMQNVRSKDSYTFSHSVNTCVLAIKVGMAMNYNISQLKKLGIGTILHDVGKIDIPDKILFKPEDLTEEEFEIIKRHPLNGYDRIKEDVTISHLARHVILYHHEKVDGSGYPKGLVGDELHDFAKIACVTDVFDALTSDRCYRDSWSNSEALSLIVSETNQEFDKEIVNKFIRNVAMYPKGTKVKLSNGYIGLVKEQNKKFPARPIVKIIENEEGEQLDSYTTIDLLEELNITIEDEKL